MSDLVIYALRVNDGILALCQMPGREGNYADDMEHLRDWKPAIVASMTTEVELVTHGAATLGADLQAMGTRWMHLPVEDFSTPSAQVDLSWKTASAQILAALSGGGRVLIHCKGGCGRSGMAVLRLMIEAGEDAHDALKRLRAVRSCAVETQGQWDWARLGLSASEAASAVTQGGAGDLGVGSTAPTSGSG